MPILSAYNSRRNYTKDNNYLYVEVPEPLKSRILDYTERTVDKQYLINAENNPHISIKCGIVTDDIESVKDAICPFKPIRVMFGAQKCFMASDTRKSDVVIIEVFGESIRRLGRKIESALEVKPEFISYMPHVTLAFVEEHTAMQYVGMNDFIEEKFVVDRVAFKTSDGRKYYITCNGEILECALNGSTIGNV